MCGLRRRLTSDLAHDVVEDMLACGMESVTMIQRSKTCKLFVRFGQVVRGNDRDRKLTWATTVVIPVKHYSKHQASKFLVVGFGMVHNNHMICQGLITPIFRQKYLTE